MKKLLVTIFLVNSVNYIYSQTDKKALEQQKYQAMLSQSSKTLIINIAGFSMNAVGEFKDEIIMWKEKITSVSIDEKENTMTIIHNGLLGVKEMDDVLSKYQIKKNKIISYN